MHLLLKRTFVLANIGCKAFYEQHASSFSCQYTQTRRLKLFATMGEQVDEEPPDLSTWSADQLLARVTLLEQQLKEQTAK